MNKMFNVTKLVFLALAIFCQTSLFAYVKSRTISAQVVHWPNYVVGINLYINPTNNNGVNTTVATNIIQDSINQWVPYVPMSLTGIMTTTSDDTNKNEIYFSDDPMIFNGIGVRGLTIIDYDQTTGYILHADVVVNDDAAIFFETDSSKEDFLGNIITHELGHLFGLTHSEVHDSSMVYTIRVGQHQINSDDINGVKSLYGTLGASEGSIKGTVVGGASLTSVFGAHVQAISQKTGQVMASALSEADGSFQIDGLTLNEDYFLYISPTRILGSISSIYGSVQNDFCDGGSSFRGSFFQSCYSSDSGSPQAIKMSSAIVNVGKVTIRCSLDSPTAYLTAKSTPSTPYSPLMTQTTYVDIGSNFVGYFSAADVNATSPSSEKIVFDLSDNTLFSSLSSGYYFLEVKLVSQPFYSKFKVNMVLKNDLNNVTGTVSNSRIDADYYPRFDVLGRIPISLTDSTKNKFVATMTPQKINTFLTGYPQYDLYDFLPNYDEITEGLYFYLVMANVVQCDVSGLNCSTISTKKYVVSDNRACPDAPQTYAVGALTTGSTTTKSAGSIEKNLSPLSCGTIQDVNDDDNDPSGPVTFFVSFIFSLLLFKIKSRKIFSVN